MPNNHNDANSENNPQSPIPDKVKNTPIVNLSVNTGVDELHHVDTENIKNNTQHDIVTINVTNQQNDYAHQIRANEIASDANSISNRSFVVNTGLLMGTIVVIILSIWQSHLANKSVQLADSVFQATKKFNDSSLRIQDTAYAKSVRDGKSQGDKDRRTLEIQDNSLSAQIKSLQEIQKESQPYLQLKVNGPITYLNGSITFFYQIYNMGKYPAKTSKLYIALNTGNRIDSAKMIRDIFKNVKYIPTTEYIGSFDPTTSHAYGGHGFTEEYYNLFKNGNKLFLLGGELQYIDVISQQKRKYKFVYQIIYWEGDKISYKTIQNDNENVK